MKRNVRNYMLLALWLGLGLAIARANWQRMELHARRRADAPPILCAGFQTTGANQIFVGYHAAKQTDGSYQTAIGSNWSGRPKLETRE